MNYEGQIFSHRFHWALRGLEQSHRGMGVPWIIEGSRGQGGSGFSLEENPKVIRD